MNEVKLIRKGDYLMVQFKDGNCLPETNLVIESPAGDTNGLVEVTVTFMADISELKDDQVFIDTVRHNKELQDKVNKLESEILRTKSKSRFW